MRGRVLNMEAAESRGSPVIPVNRGLYERLVRAGRSGQPITYAEVGRLLELSMDYPPHRTEIFQLLGVISRHEAAKGRPMLSSVVLDHTDGTPGKTFYRLGQELGLVQQAEDEISFAIRQLNDTFAFWESPDAPSVEEALRASGDEAVPQAAFTPPPVGQPRGVVNALGDSPPDESAFESPDSAFQAPEPSAQATAPTIQSAGVEAGPTVQTAGVGEPTLSTSAFFEPPPATSEPMPEFDPPGRPVPVDPSRASESQGPAPVFGQISSVRPPQPRPPTPAGPTYAHAPRLPEPTEQPPALQGARAAEPARPAADSPRPSTEVPRPSTEVPRPSSDPARPGFPVQSTAFPRSGVLGARVGPSPSVAPRAGLSAAAPSPLRPVAPAPGSGPPPSAPTPSIAPAPTAPASPTPEVREAASAAPTGAPAVESAVPTLATAPATAGERPKQPVMDPSGPRSPTTPLAGNKAIEDAAIRWVMQLERAAGRNPVDRRYDRKFPADIESEPRVIEVKAVGTNTRGWFLPIEVKQMDEARRNRNFYVYVVENTKQGDPTKFTLKVLGGTRLQQLLQGAKERRYYEVPWPTPHYDQTAGIEALSHGPDATIAPAPTAASDAAASATPVETRSPRGESAPPAAPTSGPTATAASDVSAPPATGAEEARANGAATGQDSATRAPAGREDGIAALPDRIPTEG